MKKILTLLLFTSLFVILSACNKGPYSVTFVDYKDTVLKEITIEQGERANAPTVPFRFGYTFESWDHDLDNITEDVIIRAQYEPVVFASKLHETIYSAKYAVNITESSEVYVDDSKTTDKLYKRTAHALYSMFELTENEHRVDLYMEQNNSTITGYEQSREDDCWMYTDITNDLYRHILYTHSNRAMLPKDFDFSWFSKTDNVYTLKQAYFDDMYEQADMTGAFLSYKITDLEDALGLYVKVFRHGETIEYSITFHTIGTTTIAFDSFETCTVN